MGESIQSKLEKHRADYNHVRGRSFAYFFCPILCRDDDVPLCRGHIINHAFPGSSGNWVVQRKDVDNFYGSMFEADFATIQYKGSQNLGSAIVDKDLSKKLEPKLLLNDKPVGYYISHSNIPKQFTPLQFDNDGELTQLAIKMQPEKFIEELGGKWELSIERDIRIPAMVSLIKSAHLTLFSMLGYSYALSAAGYFVGRQILGEFYLQNHKKAKQDVLTSAYPFFREFVSMVRPIQSSGINLQGTITDNFMLVCKEKTGRPWGLVVFVRTTQVLHAVLVPAFEQADTVSTYIEFMKNDKEEITVNYLRFDQDHWNMSKESTTLSWPKTGILYP